MFVTPPTGLRTAASPMTNHARGPSSPAISRPRSNRTVQIHAHGRIVASAVRTGHGWTTLVDGRRCEAPTLDELLVRLGVLPTHRRGGR
jgi:hypothetical protein